jgi:phosphate acyltransferase
MNDTMQDHVTISVDAMGGDHAPAMVIEGVALILKQQPGDVRFLLHGNRDELLPLMAQFGISQNDAEIRHTDTFVTMTQKPSEAVRRARGSSMWNAISSVKDEEAAVAVSAGNTGALMVIAKVILRMMPNAHRPAIAAQWPTINGHAVVLDVGANVEIAPPQYVEFAIMGDAFHRAVFASSSPRVGLLNVGTEDLKGHDMVRAADALIRDSQLGLNYLGYVEGNDISLGNADVVVTDGFTGNVALKTAEGTAKLVGSFVRDALTSSTIAKLGALLARPALAKLKTRMDPRSINGGVFLGLNGTVIKSHGGTDGEGFATALRLAIRMARSNYREEVMRGLQRFDAVRPQVEVEPAAAEGVAS